MLRSSRKPVMVVCLCVLAVGTHKHNAPAAHGAQTKHVYTDAFRVWFYGTYATIHQAAATCILMGIRSVRSYSVDGRRRLRARRHQC